MSRATETIKPKYLVDEKGQKKSVVLSFKDTKI